MEVGFERLGVKLFRYIPESKAPQAAEKNTESKRERIAFSLIQGGLMRTKKTGLRGNENGMSVLSAMVGVVISSIIAWAIGSSIILGARGGKSSELKQELSMLQQTIREQFDCEKSLGITSSTSLPLDCSREEYKDIPLKNKLGLPITSSSAMLGVWSLRARCDNKEVLIERAIKEGSSFRADPLSKQVYAWKDLFGSTSDFCKGYFTGTTTKFEYAGDIQRCPYVQTRGPGGPYDAEFAPNFLSRRPPSGAPKNPISGTHDCPTGFAPMLAFSFYNGGCEGGIPGWYFLCGWDKTTGAYVGESGVASWQTILRNDPSTNIVTVTSGGLGCGLEIYHCVKEVLD